MWVAGKEPHASIKLYTSDAGGAEREKRESPVIYFINWREVVSAAGGGKDSHSEH